MSHCNKELITKLLHILDYEGKSFCGLVNTDTLIDPDNESESAFDDQIFIGLSFLIIEAAKGVGLLTAQSLNSVVKGKKYKTLTIFEINSTVLKHFINEVALLHIQLPFVVPPKDFVMVEKGVYRGGYSIKELSDKYNIFVNEKYVLKPFIEDGTLAYINK